MSRGAESQKKLNNTLRGIRKLFAEEDHLPFAANETDALAQDEAAFLCTGLRTMGSVRTLPHYDCPLCHEKFLPAVDAVEIVACSHAFHRSCFFDWLRLDNFWHSSCPVCRACLFPTRHPHTPALTEDSPVIQRFATPRTILAGNRVSSRSDFGDALSDRLTELGKPDEQDEETCAIEEGKTEKKDPDRLHAQGIESGMVFVRSMPRAAPTPGRSKEAKEA